MTVSKLIIGAILLKCIIQTAAEDWNVQCPVKTETLEERINMSPFCAIIRVDEVNKIIPTLYNVSASVLCVLKGGFMDERIEIPEIKRIVEDHQSPCHTLREGGLYIVFLKLGEYGNYILLDHAEEPYDPDDGKLIAELKRVDGLEPLEIGGPGKCPQCLLQPPREEESDEEINENSESIAISVDEGSVINDISINDGVHNYIEKNAGIDFDTDEDALSGKFQGKGPNSFSLQNAKFDKYLVALLGFCFVILIIYKE